MKIGEGDGWRKPVAIIGFACFVLIAVVGVVNKLGTPQRPTNAGNGRPVDLDTIVKDRVRTETEQRRAEAEQRLRQKCSSGFAKLEADEARTYGLRRKGRNLDIGCLYASGLPSVFSAFERLRAECAPLVVLPSTLNGRTLREGIAAEVASCGLDRSKW